MRKAFLMMALFLAVMAAPAMASSTQQTNNIRMSPYYFASLTQNTNQSMWVRIAPPDGMSSVTSALFHFKVFTAGSTTTYTLYVNNQTCGTYLVDTQFANSGQYEIAFDCTLLVQKPGNYSINMKSSRDSGSAYGWLDLTYTDNPASLLSAGTEYQPNDAGRVFVRMLDGNENPINLGVCNTTIYFPNNTKLANQQPMSFLEKGYYYYDLTIPNATGNYIMGFDCLFPSSVFHQTRAMMHGVSKNIPFVDEFPFDDINNVTINSANISFYQSSGGSANLFFNGQLILTSTAEGTYSTSLRQSNFTIAEAQSFTFEEVAGTPVIENITLFVNYTANDITHIVRGQNEIHVGNMTAGLLSVNVSVDNTAVLNAIKNANNSVFAVGANLTSINFTLSSQISDVMIAIGNIPALVWSYATRTLTSFGFLTNATYNNTYNNTVNNTYWVNVSITNNTLNNTQVLNVSVQNVTNTYTYNQTLNVSVENITNTYNNTNVYNNTLNSTVIYNNTENVSVDLTNVTNAIGNLDTNMANNFTQTNDLIISTNNTVDWWGHQLNATSNWWGTFLWTTMDFWGNALETKIDNIIMGNVTVTAQVDYDEIALTTMQYLKALQKMELI